MEQNKKKRHIILITIFCIILFPSILGLCFTDNKIIQFEKVTINQNDNPIKVMQLSDMHFPKCKADTDLILDKVKEERIDIIAITGDVMDSSAKVESSNIVPFLEKIKDFEHVYFVSGNHEENNFEYGPLIKAMTHYHVKILNNTYEEITIRDRTINVLGLKDDTKFSSSYFTGINQENYNILLAHRPELFDSYTNTENNTFNPDLVLTGHAHGGQIRIFTHGFIAPDQGLNPKYDAGIYQKGDTTMFVSRGIGNSILPLRINNKPHVPILFI